MGSPVVQFLPQADTRVAGLYENPGSTFYHLILTQDPIIGVYMAQFGKCLGWACFSLADDSLLDFAQSHLPHLVIGAYVRPEHRRQGLGSKLIKALIPYYGEIQHLPADYAAKCNIARQFPCLYDPAISSLIKKSPLAFERLNYPESNQEQTTLFNTRTTCYPG